MAPRRRRKAAPGAKEVAGGGAAAAEDGQAEAELEPAPGGGAPTDALEAVRAALAGWLAHNKRMEDYRLVEREVKALSEQIKSAVRTVTPASEESPSQSSSSLVVDFGKGIRLRSVCACHLASSDEEATTVDLELHCRRPGQKAEALMAEFHSIRQPSESIDQAHFNVEHEIVLALQSALVPSLPKAIIFLEALISLPWEAPEEASAGPIPFRQRLLEDMLMQECWLEPSDAEDEGDWAEGGAAEETEATAEGQAEDQGESDAEGKTRKAGKKGKKEKTEDAAMEQAPSKASKFKRRKT